MPRFPDFRHCGRIVVVFLLLFGHIAFADERAADYGEAPLPCHGCPAGGPAIAGKTGSPGAKASPKCQCQRTSCCCGHVVDWSKVPQSIRPMPRPGDFPVRPSGLGYYSLFDQVLGIQQSKLPQSGYPPFALMPPSFFDADFRYLESLPYSQRTFEERLKRIPLGDCLTFSTGGQFWTRYMNEHNSRLTEFDNTFTLARARAYADLMYGDRFRIFGEFIWADSFQEDLDPLPIDVNRADLLNLFVDVNLFEFDGKPVFARVGRQELLLGSQRMVSTLDCANTLRTFEGVRLFRTGEKWDTDVFWTNFEPPDADAFDEADGNRNFAGAWATHRPRKGHFLDLYYLYFDNSNAVEQLGIVRAPTEVHTLGTRYIGDRQGLLYEYEVALQFGNQGGRDLLAGAATAGIGRHWQDAPLTPTFWVYYDWASGDSDPDSGDAHTFNQLYPFGHYYMGWIDQVARQNIHDINAHLFLFPRKWLTLWLQYHHFRLDHSADALYNAGGVARRRDATGNSGNHVGDEIDVIVNLHLTRYSDLLIGYSKLFGGGFLEGTAVGNNAADAELFYLNYQRKW